MNFIRIGDRVLNALAIIEAIDDPECNLGRGKERVVTLSRWPTGD